MSDGESDHQLVWPLTIINADYNLDEMDEKITHEDEHLSRKMTQNASR